MLKSKLPLIIAFAVTLISGVVCHVVKNGEASVHAAWMACQILHILACMLFLALVFKHVRPFKKWYLKLSYKDIKRKNKIAIIISVLGLFLCISGVILLLFINGAKSHVGLWHWAAGLVFSAFCLMHILRRIKI